MNANEGKLTILFEEPFWVALYERESGGRYEVCKVIFGAEPKDCEVYQYFLREWDRLRFSPVMDVAEREERCRNPKRLQREVRKTTAQSAGIGTKAQQALKLQHEQRKITRKASTRKRREDEADRQFAIRQEKRRAKHRGH